MKNILVYSIASLFVQCYLALDLNVQTPAIDILGHLRSFSQSIANVFLPELPAIKELENCGKRYNRQSYQKLYGECFWNCKWKPNPFYNSGLEKNFVRLKFEDLYENLPESYADFFYSVLAFNQEKFYIDVYFTLPMIPEDTRCLRDCFPPGNTVALRDESRYEICRYAMGEELLPLLATAGSTRADIWKSFLGFYKCLHLLNMESVENRADNDEDFPISIPKDYFQTANEICYIGLLSFLKAEFGINPAELGVDPNYSSVELHDIYNTDSILGCVEGFLCVLFGNNNDALNDLGFNVNCQTRRIIESDSSIQIRRALKNIEANFKVDKKQRGKLERKSKVHKKRKFKKWKKKVRENGDRKELISGNKIVSIIEEIAGIATNESRLAGATVFPTDLYDNINSKHHPWACSLRRAGFRGRHRCGVTMLSGPTEDSPDDPFVLVSAAHCNFICKDTDTGNILETCCCRKNDHPASCNSDENGREKSPFCTGRPVFAAAEPHDVTIVCGEFDTGVQILENSAEPEQVFQVEKIINHPHYQPNRDGIGEGGPIEGSDIAVYHVKTDYKLGNADTRDGDCKPDDDGTCDHIWPICLPKNDDEFTSAKAMIAGWLDTPPVSLTKGNSLGASISGESVIRLGTYPRVMNLQKEAQCQDPDHQRSRGVNTYYPQGTVCYTEPAQGSCADFGSSGSGIVREWKEYKKTTSFDFPSEKDRFYQYSFVGPLSMSKGCDLSISLDVGTNEDDKPDPVFIYRGANSLVATDATCFMPWIVAQYDLKLPDNYKIKDSCFTGVGDKKDINKDMCWTSRNTRCNFKAEVEGENRTMDSCETYSLEGIAYNVNRCIDIEGKYAVCDNNCKGVNPNAIIGAGVAAVGIIGISAQAIAGPAAGIGLGGLAVGGGMRVLESGQCGQLQCRVRGRCVNLVPVGRRMYRCPLRG